MLDPRVLSSIADLELVARVTVGGTISGLHRSPFHGYSAEFSQYRHYRPGDDLKHVDWKLFARTDRVYTKQYRETTNMPVQFAVDASASMGFRGANGVSKFEYARILAAALAHLVSSQSDAVGLAVFADVLREHVPARPGQPHLRRVLTALSSASPGASAASASALRKSIDMLKRRGLFIVFSDFYEETEVDDELRRATRAGHEVAAFQVLTSEETTFPYQADVEFEDLESGRRVLTNSAAIAAAYRQEFDAFLSRWRNRCGARGIDYTSALTDMPPDEVLRTYLLRRSRAAGG